MIAMQDELRPAALKSKKRRLLKWLVIALLVLGVLVAGGWFGWQKFHDPSPIPKNIRQSVNFPLYYPKPVPVGFRINKESFSTNGKVVLYSFSYTGSDSKKYSLAITIQPAISGLTTTSNFNPSDQFTVNIGQAYLAEFEIRDSAAITTPKSTLFLNTNGPIASSDFKNFINNMIEIK